MKTLLLFLTLALTALCDSLHAQSFVTKTLDFGSGGKTGQHSSQAVINGNPAIAYYNETDSSLMFARNSAPDGSGLWSITTVQYLGSVGQFPSLAQVDGRPAISYLDGNSGFFKYVQALNPDGTRWSAPVTLGRATNVSQDSRLLVVNGNPAVLYYGNSNDGSQNGILIYIRSLDADGTTWGSPQIIDSIPGTGKSPSFAVINGNPAATYCRGAYLLFVRALDANGTNWGEPLSFENLSIYGSGKQSSLVVVNGNPAIAYMQSLPNNRWGLGFVRSLDQNGTTWGTRQILDDSSDQTGQYPSLAVIDGKPAISYFDYTNSDLKYTRALDADGAAWGTHVSLDHTGEVGSFDSLAEVGGHPAISYYDTTNGNLKYLRSQDTAGGNWPIPVTVDEGFESGEVGSSVSHAVINGNPAVAYYDITNGALKYIRALDARGINWGDPITIGNAARLEQCVFLTTVNGRPAIGYSGVGGVLKYVRALDADGTSWQTPVTADGSMAVGSYITMAVVNGSPAIACFDSNNFDLRYVGALDPNGATWRAPLIVDSLGTVGISPSLAVINGRPAIAYPDPSLQKIKYLRASDADGLNWGTPLVLDNMGNENAFPSLKTVNGRPAISYYHSTTRHLNYLRALDADGADWGTAVSVGTPYGAGRFLSMAVINGNPAISYYGEDSSLGFVTALDNNGTSWGTPETVDSTSLGNSSSLIEVDGSAAICYYDIPNGNLKWAIRGSEPALPDISVSESGPLGDGGGVNFGISVVEVGKSLTFTISNPGSAPLTGLSVSKDGPDAGDFIIAPLSGTSIAVGADTVTFDIVFTPASGGAKVAAIHIASNVGGTKNPFDTSLTGRSLTFTQDSDGDGLSDASEFQMAALGFDWQVSQTALVDVYKAAANGAGLFTLPQIQDLNINTPLIRRESPNKFTLTLGVEKSTTLQPGSFLHFPMSPSQTTINTAGNLEFTFTLPDDAAFFRLHAR